MATIQTQGFTLDNSGKRIVVDPITRIEGHLRIEVNVDKDNVIRNAVSTGTMWRGLEVILKGRDPRDAWAFVERICGVCTGVHALASVRSVEDALAIKIPKNANTIRNLMHATLYAQDHLVHFYHLHALDWVDVVSALKADPKKTSELAQSVSPWPNSSPGYFRDVQNRLKRFVEGGQLGIFANGYWGSPAYKLPAEANLMATTHYLEALDFQKEIVKIQTIFGGKNPHPNWLVGGMPCSINLDSSGAVGAINMTQLNMVSDIINRTIDFIDQVYIPDLLAIASFYKDWAKWGGGLSSQNVMSYGEFPDIANDYGSSSLLMPSGVILGGDLKNVMDVDLKAPDQVQEWVSHSWYKQGDESKGLHPFDGVTDPNFVLGAGTKGTRTNIENLDEMAQAIHNESSRRNEPFVAISCATIPRDLIESELFGYRGGAFTGARREGQVGKFELANRGTLFLDEVNGLPLDLQAKLLRVLQQNEILRLGDTRPIPIDVRVLAASNCDLMLEVENGGFRKDLYYRLNVVEIFIPPLRERMEDLDLLIDHIMRRLCREMGVQKPKISTDAMETLKKYHWPGNVRELENCIERALLLAQGPTIQKLHIPERTFKRSTDPLAYSGSLHHAFKSVIESAIEECGGNISMAAKKLQIARSTLYRKMKEFGLSQR